MAHLIYLSISFAITSRGIHSRSAYDPLPRADWERIPSLLSDWFREVTRLFGWDVIPSREWIPFFGSGSGSPLLDQGADPLFWLS